MFNQAQQDIINTLVPTMREKGYKYYVAYSFSDPDRGDYYFASPDLYFVFSKEKITASSAYSYTCPKGSVRFSCRSVNYSSSRHAVNTDRIESAPFSGKLTIEPYEHIYSNAEFAGTTIQPDIFKGEGVSQNVIGTANTFILCAILFLLVFFKIFRL